MLSAVNPNEFVTPLYLYTQRQKGDALVRMTLAGNLIQQHIEVEIIKVDTNMCLIYSLDPPSVCS